MLRYLGRYTHRVALANHRILRLEADRVAFRYRDYADGHRVKVLELSLHEFIRRFLLHVLPTGFVRIRSYGLLANRHRKKAIAHCRTLLRATDPATAPTAESLPDRVLRLIGLDLTACPQCGEGRMRVIAELARTPFPAPPPEILDSSRAELEPEDPVLAVTAARPLVCGSPMRGAGAAPGPLPRSRSSGIQGSRSRCGRAVAVDPIDGPSPVGL